MSSWQAHTFCGHDKMFIEKHILTYEIFSNPAMTENGGTEGVLSFNEGEICLRFSVKFRISFEDK
jgi:hypothetical protein